MAPVTQASTYIGGVHIGALTQIGSVLGNVPMWTTKQEEQLKVYSQKHGNGVPH